MLHSLGLHFTTSRALESVHIGNQLHNMPASKSSVIVLRSLFSHLDPNHGFSSMGSLALSNLAEELKATPSALHLAVPAGELAHDVSIITIPKDEVPSIPDSASVMQSRFNAWLRLTPDRPVSCAASASSKASS